MQLDIDIRRYIWTCIRIGWGYNYEIHYPVKYEYEYCQSLKWLQIYGLKCKYKYMYPNYRNLFPYSLFEVDLF